MNILLKVNIFFYKVHKLDCKHKQPEKHPIDLKKKWMNYIITPVTSNIPKDKK